MAAGRVPGERKCVNGKEYEYVPVPGATVTKEPAQAATIDALVAQVKLLQTLVDTYEFENTYKGMYRNITDLLIQAGKTNFPVDIGFPVRLFYLTTAYPITMRITSPTGDPIALSSATSPFVLEDIPAGLAFQIILITNSAATDITISIFAMG